MSKSIERLEQKEIIELPNLIDIKYNALANLAKNCRKLHLNDTAVLIADEQTYSIAGKKAEENLTENGYEVHVLKVTKATMGQVEKAQKFYKEVNAKFAIAVGGGTVIDITKLSSFYAGLPFVSVPTVASHDGIASARASIKDSESSHSLSARPPALVIGDIETLSTAPPKFATAGAGDLISNRTAVLDWELSKRITGEHVSQYSSLLSKLTASSIIENRDNFLKDSILRTYTVFKGLISSSMAMCIAGSSRPCSGAEHIISHRLDQLLEKPKMHGMQVGLMSIFSMYLHGGNWRELQDTLRAIKSPATIAEIGADEDIIIEAIISAKNFRRDRFTILSTGVTKKACIHALEETNLI